MYYHISTQLRGYPSYLTYPWKTIALKTPAMWNIVWEMWYVTILSRPHIKAAISVFDSCYWFKLFKLLKYPFFRPILTLMDFFCSDKRLETERYKLVSKFVLDQRCRYATCLYSARESNSSSIESRGSTSTWILWRKILRLEHNWTVIFWTVKWFDWGGILSCPFLEHIQSH